MEKVKIGFNAGEFAIRLICVYGENGRFTNLKAVKITPECQITVESVDSETVLDAFSRWTKELSL